jgi:hypothetical protein
MPLAANGSAALDAFIVALMATSFIVLGVICWIFWKAKKRDDAERAAKKPPPGG